MLLELGDDKRVMILGSFSKHSRSVGSVRRRLSMDLQANEAWVTGQNTRDIVPNRPLPISSHIWYLFFNVSHMFLLSFFLVLNF